jgi:hypothetical protein
VDAGIVAASIGAISAVGGVVLTAYLSLRSYRQQKNVDHENYAAQKAIDRQEYAAQKETDREIELRNLRMKEYERYLTAFRGVTSLYDFDPPPAENSKERIAAVNELRFAYSNLFQIASDPVLTAVTAFHKLAWNYETDLKGEAFNQEWRHLYANMIVEMRRDAFAKTQLRNEVVEQNVPFDLSTPATDEQTVESRGGEEKDKL